MIWEKCKGIDMISDIQQKYEQLSPAQKEIFAGYGLRQVKHFVEINLPAMQAILPEQAVIRGINAQGKVQAVHTETGQGYLWISDRQWQESQQLTQTVDATEDFMQVWKVFNLAEYDLIDLSHVHRDFLDGQQA